MAKKLYDHQAIEKKWQQAWAQAKVFAAPDAPAAPEQYVLDMFPYPSGDGLHVGHPEGYTATDIVSRYLRMNGQTVLHPMGWDAFGLPAENAAIKKGIHPSILTKENVANFKRQIQSIGFSYDWDREINTTDPKYYKWTQWIFLQLFKAGLAYEKEAPIWWCPKDKTGLANEEVVDGKCERCGTTVERKMLKQWMLKITAYAERLLEGLEKVDWPESVKTLQRNWIGKSEGAEIDFLLDFKKDPRANENRGPNGERALIKVYTTRPDTIFGATYLVLAPEHPWVTLALNDQHDVLENKSAVKKYVASVSRKSDIERLAEGKEKTGVQLKGVMAINPATNEEIPLFVADYVLASYGTGAIMAVPAHDRRDFAFAKKFKLPVQVVVTAPAALLEKEGMVWVGEGMIQNSHQFDGLKSEEAREKIVAWLAKEGKAQPKIQYKLRDWVFSRQRYWGEPIPLVHCDNCKQTVESTSQYLNFYHPKIWQNLIEGRKTIETRALNPDEPERDFSTIKPEDYIKAIFKPTGETAYLHVKRVKKYASLKELFADKRTMMGVAPTKIFTSLKELEEAYEKMSPGYLERIKKHGLIAFEVKKVMPGIILVKEEELPVLLPDVEKYEPTGTGESPLANISEWVHTTCPKCDGPAKRETNTMPQWAGSCWYYIRFCDPHNDTAMADPAKLKAWLPIDLYVGGAEHAVLHLMYARFWHKVLFDAGHIPKEVGDEPFAKLKNQGLILGSDGEKMSKSRGNVVNPDDSIAEFGADAFRIYEMFMGPFEDAKPWNTNGLVGVRRFLERVWAARERAVPGERTASSHRYVAAMTNGIPDFQFNTSVSDLMKWSNEWKGDEMITVGDYEAFLKVLSPFAPHIAEELWHALGHETFLSQEAWPTYDPTMLRQEKMTIAVQVNGKHRGNVTVQAGSNESVVREAAELDPNVKKFLTGEPKKVIFVPDRLLNYVV